MKRCRAGLQVAQISCKVGESATRDDAESGPRLRGDTVVVPPRIDDDRIESGDAVSEVGYKSWGGWVSDQTPLQVESRSLKACFHLQTETQTMSPIKVPTAAKHPLDAPTAREVSKHRGKNPHRPPQRPSG